MQAQIVTLLLSISHLLLGVVGAGHALLYKRDPRAAVGWIAVCMAIPFIGPLAYYLFGINRVRTAAREFRRGGMIGYERAERHVAADYCPHPADRLSSVGAVVSGSPLLSGNAVVPLHNGEQVYARMLDAINSASRSVRLATYIFETDATGREFIDALARAAARGVEVRVLLDGIGQHYAFPSARGLLRKAGVETRVFMPPRLIPPSLRINLRNHRKVLVVDEGTGFTGGINIGGRHVAAPDGTRKVTDLHFEMRGPVVSELDAAFCRDWYFAAREQLAPAGVDATVHGDAICRLILDGPDENLDRLEMVIRGVIGAAERRIDIMTPYFLPTREMIGALQAAATRGVRVRIILPEKNNLPFVHWATRNMLWELLQWNIEVLYQPPPFCHSKLLLIDDDYALVGSANIDPRSLRLNFELGVEIFDRGVVALLDRHVAEVCDCSRPTNLDEVDGRPLWQRIRDAVFWLLSPYL